MVDIVLKINNIEDIDEILLVSEAVFKPNQQEREKYENKPDWLEKIKNGLLVSAVVDNKIVGFSISYKKEDDFHIWKVGVLNEFRKMGIWRKMYDEIKRHAIENGFKKITLNTYQERFPGMYSFCEKEGFVEYETEIDPLLGMVKSRFVKKL